MAQFLSTSRYVSSSYTQGETTTPTANRIDTDATRFTNYTAKDGDSFDLLATKYMNDPMRWWEIADLNPHVPFPDTIPLGTVIRIPT